MGPELLLLQNVYPRNALGMFIHYLTKCQNGLLYNTRTKSTCIYLKKLNKYEFFYLDE